MDVTIRPFAAADAHWVAETHSGLYARDEGFDSTFGALVEQIVTGFVSSHDAGREQGWIAEGPEGRLGCIFCVAFDETVAQLRLFLLLPEARGRGLGRRLLETCTEFAARAGYERMVLWTHAEHEAACALYERSGWVRTSAEPVESFGRALTEEHWERDLRGLAIAAPGG